MRSSLLLGIGLCLSSAARFSAAADDIEAHRSQVAALAQEVVKEHRLTMIGADGVTHLVPGREPLLRWSNPTVGDVHGEVLVWTDQGRAICLASVYRGYTPNWGSTLEITSLSHRPLTGSDASREYWRPQRGGVTWTNLPDAPPPAMNMSGRLVQMKRLAEEFTATLEDTRGDGQPVPRKLRLMARPLYRYPPNERSECLDGAVFSFVESTDPEVLLVIEAPREATAGGWRYAVTRMNRDALTVSHGNQVVWRTKPLALGDFLGRTAEPYAIFILHNDTGVVVGNLQGTSP